VHAAPAEEAARQPALILASLGLQQEHLTDK